MYMHCNIIYYMQFWWPSFFLNYVFAFAKCTIIIFFCVCTVCTDDILTFEPDQNTFLYCFIETIWLVNSSMTDTVAWHCLSWAVCHSKYTKTEECIVSPSSNYGLWLSLWYLQTFPSQALVDRTPFSHLRYSSDCLKYYKYIKKSR